MDLNLLNLKSIQERAAIESWTISIENSRTTLKDHSEKKLKEVSPNHNSASPNSKKRQSSLTFSN